MSYSSSSASSRSSLSSFKLLPDTLVTYLLEPALYNSTKTKACHKSGASQYTDHRCALPDCMSDVPRDDHNVVAIPVVATVCGQGHHLSALGCRAAALASAT